MTTGDPTEVFEELRSTLIGAAYRILGSRVEAEDVVQEAWIRWSGVEHDTRHRRRRHQAGGPAPDPRGRQGAALARRCARQAGECGVHVRAEAREPRARDRGHLRGGVDGVIFVTIEDDRITALHGIRNPEKLGAV